jgi:hypothetical protein
LDGRLGSKAAAEDFPLCLASLAMVLATALSDELHDSCSRNLSLAAYITSSTLLDDRVITCARAYGVEGKDAGEHRVVGSISDKQRFSRGEYLGDQLVNSISSLPQMHTMTAWSCGKSPHTSHGVSAKVIPNLEQV